MVQMSALSASAATAAGESKQKWAPPAPVLPLSGCTNSPLGCSALDYDRGSSPRFPASFFFKKLQRECSLPKIKKIGW